MTWSSGRPICFQTLIAFNTLLYHYYSNSSIEAIPLITLFPSAFLLFGFAEISDLKQQNEQLQAATRSRLQASDIERQDEIEQLKMRLEAREATIAKLEALASTKAPSSKKKGGKLLRKKKSKNADGNSVMSGMASIEELE